MGRCFVIQPFDKGRFDKRYDDVFAPAITDAGLEPYRVDRDPGVVIPIDRVASEIVGSEAVLSDITTDNPNVWFELGYAIAAQREVILVCSSERSTPFPFDVQHRAIIKYETESLRDFESLKAQITAKLKAAAGRREALQQVTVMSPVARLQGLDQFEVAALVSVAQQIDHPDDGASMHAIRQDMASAGFTKLAATMGVRSLIDKELLQPVTLHDIDGSVYTAYALTDKGMRWLFSNRDQLALRIEKPDIPF